ncbi:hypothetical protein NITHO_730004 [Nitrolancea hollandica Lb]|uniref:Uncharacterized protein n=1 Tax=Nitrolancea hollandica Lb TaxID=1129897 RepID=I4EN36_9BACT|nr:hypothetical protein NITHO_730004 [Nitrolancea hollandica Lb]
MPSDCFLGAFQRFLSCRPLGKAPRQRWNRHDPPSGLGVLREEYRVLSSHSMSSLTGTRAVRRRSYLLALGTFEKPRVDGLTSMHRNCHNPYMIRVFKLDVTSSLASRRFPTCPLECPHELRSGDSWHPTHTTIPRPVISPRSYELVHAYYRMILVHR